MTYNTIPPDNRQTLLISLMTVLLCPLVALIPALWLETFSSHYEATDVFGELLQLVLIQFWIVVVGLAQLKQRTYRYLLAGFAMLIIAQTADLLDEFTNDRFGYLKLLENLINPIGMITATWGLFCLSRDYRSLIDAIHQERDQWRSKANQDALTGLYNRRYFFSQAERLISQPAPEKANLALLMMDIDHFKQVNDRFGHPVGDQLLTCVAERLRHSCSRHCMIFRIGGEEFCIITPATDIATALSISEQLKQQISAILLTTPDNEQVSCTISVGVSLLKPQDSLGEWLRRADQALYRAKRQGRDQVVFDSSGNFRE